MEERSAPVGYSVVVTPATPVPPATPQTPPGEAAPTPTPDPVIECTSLDFSMTDKKFESAEYSSSEKQVQCPVWCSENVLLH